MTNPDTEVAYRIFSTSEEKNCGPIKIMLLTISLFMKNWVSDFRFNYQLSEQLNGLKFPSERLFLAYNQITLTTAEETNDLIGFEF